MKLLRIKERSRVLLWKARKGRLIPDLVRDIVDHQLTDLATAIRNRRHQHLHVSPEHGRLAAVGRRCALHPYAAELRPRPYFVHEGPATE